LNEHRNFVKPKEIGADGMPESVVETYTLLFKDKCHDGCPKNSN
jgi:hypothetical protein